MKKCKNISDERLNQKKNNGKNVSEEIEFEESEDYI